MKPLASFPPASSVFLAAGGPIFDWATNVPLVRRTVALVATCGGVRWSSTHWTGSQREAQAANGGDMATGVFLRDVF